MVVKRFAMWGGETGKWVNEYTDWKLDEGTNISFWEDRWIKNYSS